MLSFTPEAIDTLVGRGYREASKFHDQLLSIKQTVDSLAGGHVIKTLQAPHAKNLSQDSVYIQSISFNNVNERVKHWLLRKGGLHDDPS